MWEPLLDGSIWKKVKRSFFLFDAFLYLAYSLRSVGGSKVEVFVRSIRREIRIEGSVEKDPFPVCLLISRI